MDQYNLTFTASRLHRIIDTCTHHRIDLIANSPVHVYELYSEDGSEIFNCTITSWNEKKLIRDLCDLWVFDISEIEEFDTTLTGWLYFLPYEEQEVRVHWRHRNITVVGAVFIYQ